jgi:predicted glutamine amidotransferase
MFGEILALNFDCLGSPSIKLKAGENSQALKTPGWGFGWYPNDDYGASIIKAAMANDTHALLNALQDGTSFRSTIIMCKVKGAGKQYTQHDTQPFRRSFGGYDWLFLHNGQMDLTALKELHKDPSGLLEPVGKTDSELAFCFLLGKLLAWSAKGLTDIMGSELLAWMEELDGLGTADLVVSDGRSLAIYHGKNSERNLYFHRVLPSEKPPVFESELGCAPFSWFPPSSCMRPPSSPWSPVVLSSSVEGRFTGIACVMKRKPWFRTPSPKIPRR